MNMYEAPLAEDKPHKSPAKGGIMQIEENGYETAFFSGDAGQATSHASPHFVATNSDSEPDMAREQILARQ